MHRRDAEGAERSFQSLELHPAVSPTTGTLRDLGASAVNPKL